MQNNENNRSVSLVEFTTRRWEAQLTENPVVVLHTDETVCLTLARWDSGKIYRSQTRSTRDKKTKASVSFVELAIMGMGSLNLRTILLAWRTTAGLVSLKMSASGKREVHRN